MSFSIFRSGGKQYKVSQGDRLQIGKIAGEKGDSITIDDVLMTSAGLGGGSVTLKILNQTKGPKIRVFKRLRRKGFHKTKGHRQDYTEVEVTAI